MPLQIVHSDYIARVALKIFPQHGPETLKEEEIPGWVYGALPSERGTNQLVHRYMKGQLPPFFLFLDEVTERRWLIEYLTALCQRSNRMPDGGLGFIDRVTGELIETNWDVGETEEWTEILGDLLSADATLHTFSATDAAIELRSMPEGVSIQNLNWEAVPERLSTSRQTEPQHVFKNQASFISQVQQCLTQLDLLLSDAQKLSGNYKITILDYLSVAHRRNCK